MNYKILAPEFLTIDKLLENTPLMPFDDSVLDFIDILSNRIFKDPVMNKTPELVALAFWIRKANILKLKEKFLDRYKERLLIGRGVAFHIAPANVDTVFVYSWLLSMIAGNTSIVRISENTVKEVALLIETIKKISSHDTGSRFLITTYGHDDDVTSYFSSICDIRIIWGGDQTINKIRQIPIKPIAHELTFADKFSMSMIKADSFLNLTNKNSIMEGFYNDAYWFGQMACSSPKLIVWVGSEERVKEAKNIFFTLLKDIVRKKSPEFSPSLAIDKLTTMQSIALKFDNIDIGSLQSGYINTISLNSPKNIDRNIHCGGGLFYELTIPTINELKGVISKKEQTISVFGFEKNELIDFVKMSKPNGIDRFVSFGKALQFSSTWDGFDLLREFTREIDFDL